MRNARGRIPGVGTALARIPPSRSNPRPCRQPLRAFVRWDSRASISPSAQGRGHTAIGRHSPDAAKIGAVNTVRRDGHRLIGENTDGKGFLRGVREAGGIDPRGKRIVVLGGGAVRAISVELRWPARPKSRS